ncbi:MAG: hypothetical protein IMZ53_02975 [Thermoplasmata archaeon]|nr:hypothetical protein [Thermoplasmata archaeon]
MKLTTYMCTILLFLSTLMYTGCNSSLRVNTFTDANSPTLVAGGNAANILAQQVADNMKTEAARLSDLFKYNSMLFIVLFAVVIGGVIFAVLTKSSWGWVIPTTAGGGLTALVFITQAAVYIKWIGLGVVVVTLGVLIYKAWEYQRERNALIKGKP